MFGLILVAPVIQMIFLGYAATLDINNVHTVFYDMDNSFESRNFISGFSSSGFFKVDYADSYTEITNLIDRGEAMLAVIIPENFQEKLMRAETADIQALFDASDGNTASISAGYVSKIVSDYSKKLSVTFLSKSGRKIPVGNISAEIRIWYNPTLKTRNFMVPGIVGLLLSIITLILTSLAIVKEKEIGTLEQLIVTPIKPYQLIIGKLIPFIILGFIAVILVLIGMTVIFNIPIRGSIPFLFLSSFFYILSTLGLGLFISTISKTQQQAMMIAIFGMMMPMVYLSGFAFPLENMPQIIQWISYAVPLRYFITIIRGVILKGIGFSDLWVEAFLLLFIGIIILYLSSLRFRKRLE
jgi:ABC-2 type transport system permease protein